MHSYRLAALACLLAATQAQAQTSIPEILSQVSEKRIEANIRKLASFGTRNSLSNPDDEKRGIGAARRWIKAELERCSAGTPLQVAFDENLVESGRRVPKPTNFVNVVATLPGSQPESRDRYYVVSGHYDSMPSSPIDGEKDAPGANDDASGTAVSMSRRVRASLVRSWPAATRCVIHSSWIRSLHRARNNPVCAKCSSRSRICAGYSTHASNSAV